MCSINFSLTLHCVLSIFRLFDKFKNKINAISQEVWRDMGLFEDSSSGEDEEVGAEAGGASASTPSRSRALLPTYPQFLFLRRGGHACAQAMALVSVLLMY